MPPCRPLSDHQAAEGLALDLVVGQGLGHDEGAGFEVSADEEGGEGAVDLDAGAAEDRAADAEGLECVGGDGEEVDAVAEVSVDLRRSDGAGLGEDGAELVAATDGEVLDVAVDGL